MGISIEFNPDLCLRHIGLSKTGDRELAECIPEPLVQGKTYEFLKKGQRFYWLFGELPLLQTEGEGKLSRPVASVHIEEVTHFKKGIDVWTRGKYKVKEVFVLGPEVHFEGFQRIIP